MPINSLMMYAILSKCTMNIDYENKSTGIQHVYRVS